MKKPKNSGGQKLERFLKSVWAFPVILFVVAMFFVAFKIHGSSIGMFNRHLYGAEQQDPDLLFGKPRSIRSDEWLSNTPMTISQYYNNYPVVNNDVGPNQDGEGHDMTVVKDFPTASWETFFKPQNWGFFFMPLENAFSYRWVMLSYLLIVSAYFFVLKMIPSKRGLAILFALILYLSPFLHWWYLYTSFGSIFYTLFALIFLMNLHQAKSKLHKSLWAAGLVYVGVGWALILYPPFQISAALVGAFFYAGWLLKNYDIKSAGDRKKILLDLIYIAVAGMAVLGILLAYYLQREDVVRAIMNSAHPGDRRIMSGDRSWAYFVHEMAPQMQYRLQLPGAGITYLQNQSEQANWILFAPFLAVPSLYIIFKDWRKKLRPDWLIISMVVIIVLLFVRQHVENTDVLYKLFALDRVPNYRLLMGIGVAQFMLLVAYFRRDIKSIFASFKEKIFLVVVALAALATYLYMGLEDKRIYYDKFATNWEVVLVSAALAVIVYLLITKRVAGLYLLAAFSLLSVGVINPVYRGLKPITETPVTKEIRKVSGEDDLWAVMEDIRYENLALASGRPSLSGLYSYPRKDLWQPLLDADMSEQDIYNRSAHVSLYNQPEPGQAQLQLLAVNRFGVLVNMCSDYVKQVDLDFVLSPKPIDSKCAKEISKVEYPKQTFYIYKLAD